MFANFWISDDRLKYRDLQHNLFFVKACVVGTYGSNCNNTCGNCLIDNDCFHTNGTCLTGCDLGYTGDVCETRE